MIFESLGGGGKTCITVRVYPTLAVGNEARLFSFNSRTKNAVISKLSAWRVKKARINIFEETIRFLRIAKVDVETYGGGVSKEVNKDNLIANESLSPDLERYKEWAKLLEERQNVDLDFGKCFVPQQELSAKQDLWFQMSNPSNESSDPSPIKVDVPSELPKVSLVNTSLKKLKSYLAKFDSMVKTKITPSALTEDLLNEITEVQIVFNQMEAAVKRLLEQIISQDIVNIVVNSSVDINDYVNVHVKSMEMCHKYLELEDELIKQHNMVGKDEYNKLLKSYSKLEQHCISLELAMQLNREIFQKNNTSVNQTEPTFN
nr:fructan 6-exohydrolase-like [Tanacetum cinerariifolium]